jgi:hypothetical protein
MARRGESGDGHIGASPSAAINTARFMEGEIRQARPGGCTRPRGEDGAAVVHEPTSRR